MGKGCRLVRSNGRAEFSTNTRQFSPVPALSSTKAKMDLPQVQSRLAKYQQKVSSVLSGKSTCAFESFLDLFTQYHRHLVKFIATAQQSQSSNSSSEKIKDQCEEISREFWSQAQSLIRFQNAVSDDSITKQMRLSSANFKTLLCRLKEEFGKWIGNLETKACKIPATKKALAKYAILYRSLHWSLSCYGDLLRYEAGNAEDEGDDILYFKLIGEAETAYRKAIVIQPNDGKSYHQLAIVMQLLHSDLWALYFYYRSISVKNPYESLKERFVAMLERRYTLHKVKVQKTILGFDSSLLSLYFHLLSGVDVDKFSTHYLYHEVGFPSEPPLHLILTVVACIANIQRRLSPASELLLQKAITLFLETVIALCQVILQSSSIIQSCGNSFALLVQALAWLFLNISLLQTHNEYLFKTCLEFCMRVINVAKVKTIHENLWGRALPEEWACRGFSPLKEIYGSGQIFTDEQNCQLLSLDMIANWSDNIREEDNEYRVQRIHYFLLQISKKSNGLLKFDGENFSLAFEQGPKHLVTTVKQLVCHIDIKKKFDNPFSLAVNNQNQSLLKVALERLKTIPADDESRLVNLRRKLEDFHDNSQADKADLKPMSSRDIFIFDTNIYLYHLRDLTRAVEESKVATILPLTVFQELKGLSQSSRDDSLSALDFIQKCLSQREHVDLRIITNTGNYLTSLEYDQETWDFEKIRQTTGKDFVTADDVIIMCCIYATENLTMRSVLWHFKQQHETVQSESDFIVASSFTLQVIMTAYEDFSLKAGLAKMLKGGVIMDVVNSEQAKIAQEAGACAVMALERVPFDIIKSGGIARMASPELVREIIRSVSIPVMAKCRIGHFVEAQKILQHLGVDFIDESEVLTKASDTYIDKHSFKVPFVCGCKNLREASARIGEGAAMIRTKGFAGTGNVAEAVKHAETIRIELKKCHDGTLVLPCDISSEYLAGRLPVVNFAAGGIATPADAALMMSLGSDGVFVGSGIFKSSNPVTRAKAIVNATTYWDRPDILAEVSEGLGTAMN